MAVVNSSDRESHFRLAVNKLVRIHKVVADFEPVDFWSSTEQKVSSKAVLLGVFTRHRQTLAIDD